MWREAMVSAVALFGAVPYAYGVDSAPWPMFRHDLLHTGRSEFTGHHYYSKRDRTLTTPQQCIAVSFWFNV